MVPFVGSVRRLSQSTRTARENAGMEPTESAALRTELRRPGACWASPSRGPGGRSCSGRENRYTPGNAQHMVVSPTTERSTSTTTEVVSSRYVVERFMAVGVAPVREPTSKEDLLRDWIEVKAPSGFSWEVQSRPRRQRPGHSSWTRVQFDDWPPRVRLRPMESKRAPWLLASMYNRGQRSTGSTSMPMEASPNATTLVGGAMIVVSVRPQAVG